MTVKIAEKCLTRVDNDDIIKRFFWLPQTLPVLPFDTFLVRPTIWVIEYDNEQPKIAEIFMVGKSRTHCAVSWGFVVDSISGDLVTTSERGSCANHDLTQIQILTQPE